MKPSLEHLGKEVYYLPNPGWLDRYDGVIASNKIAAVTQRQYILENGSKLNFYEYKRNDKGWGSTWSFDREFLERLIEDNKARWVKNKSKWKQEEVKSNYLNEQLQLTLKIQKQGYIWGIISGGNTPVKIEVKGFRYQFNGGKKYPKIIIHTNYNAWCLNKLNKTFFIDEPKHLMPEY